MTFGIYKKPGGVRPAFKFKTMENTKSKKDYEKIVEYYFDLWNDSNRHADKLAIEVSKLKSLLDQVIRNKHTVNDKLLDKILIALGR